MKKDPKEVKRTKEWEKAFGKDKNEGVESFSDVISGIIAVVVVFGLFIFFLSSVGDIFGWVGDKMDSRDSRKERCIEETYNIKNEFTAKKMYKACMKR